MPKLTIQFHTDADKMEAEACVAGWRVLMDSKRPAWGTVPVLWSDATTPRTDKPVRFSKGEHRVYRGGNIVRLARMGTPSRIA